MFNRILAIGTIVVCVWGGIPAVALDLPAVEITSVVVGGQTLSIGGQFERKSSSDPLPSVLMGGPGGILRPLQVLDATQVLIRALLPTAPAPAPGTYRLVVSLDKKRESGFDVTIGSSGPVGPAGPVGSVGSVGPQGPQGSRGSVGPGGATGPAGLGNVIVFRYTGTVQTFTVPPGARSIQAELWGAGGGAGAGSLAGDLSGGGGGGGGASYLITASNQILYQADGGQGGGGAVNNGTTGTTGGAGGGGFFRSGDLSFWGPGTVFRVVVGGGGGGAPDGTSFGGFGGYGGGATGNNGATLLIVNTGGTGGAGGGRSNLRGSGGHTAPGVFTFPSGGFGAQDGAGGGFSNADGGAGGVGLDNGITAGTGGTSHFDAGENGKNGFVLITFGP